MADSDSGFSDQDIGQQEGDDDDENELHVSTFVHKQKAVYIFRAFRAVVKLAGENTGRGVT